MRGPIRRVTGAWVDVPDEDAVRSGTGRIRTHMHVGLVNDGPVTVLLEV